LQPHLSRLEWHLPRLVHQLRADLDQLLPQCRQRPRLHSPGLKILFSPCMTLARLLARPLPSRLGTAPRSEARPNFKHFVPVASLCADLKSKASAFLFGELCTTDEERKP
jgi:hypothetical protein